MFGRRLPSLAEGPVSSGSAPVGSILLREIVEQAREEPGDPTAHQPRANLNFDSSDNFGIWGETAQSIRQYDEGRIGVAKEEVDTLLVFSGLFSAVVTAFLVDAYKGLQNRPEEKGLEILMRISQQLGSIAIMGGSLNSTAPPFSGFDPFESSRSTLCLTSLWTLCLISSLAAASLSLFIKQWLDEFMTYTNWAPREQIVLRIYREAGCTGTISSWTLDICPCVEPHCGLDYLRVLDRLVSVSLRHVICPDILAQCPYKTPILNDLLASMRGVFIAMIGWCGKLLSSMGQTNLGRRFKRVADRLHSFEEKGVCLDDRNNVAALLCIPSLIPGSYRPGMEIFNVFKQHSYVDVLSALQEVQRQPQNFFVSPHAARSLQHGMRQFMIQVITRHLRPHILSSSMDVTVFRNIYDNLCSTIPLVYDPTCIGTQNTILPESLVRALADTMWIGTTQAGLSVLIMYSVGLRIIQDHPDRWKKIINGRTSAVLTNDTPSDLVFHNQTIKAIRTILSVFWQDSYPGDDTKSLQDCIRAATRPDRETQAPDIILLLHLFVEMWRWKPDRSDPRSPYVWESGIREVLEEMADIVEAYAAPTILTHARKSCLKSATNRLKKLCVAASFERQRGVTRLISGLEALLQSGGTQSRSAT